MNWRLFYDKAYEWILNIGPKLIVGLVVLFIGLWLIKILKRWLNRHLLRNEVVSSVRPFLVNLAVTTLQLLLVLAFMQIVGLQMTMFAAILGAFGVAAGLALSGTLQNFTSGILILILKPFKVGDNILAQGQEGTVDSIQIFFTVVKTYDNRTVIIPNSKLSNEIIVNLSREGKRRLDIELKLSFAIDFNQVKKIAEQSIGELPNLLTEPISRIGVSSVDPDGYKIMISVWAPSYGFQDTRLLLQQHIINDVKSAGIKLPGL